MSFVLHLCLLFAIAAAALSFLSVSFCLIARKVKPSESTTSLHVISPNRRQ